MMYHIARVYIMSYNSTDQNFALVLKEKKLPNPNPKASYVKCFLLPMKFRGWEVSSLSHTLLYSFAVVRH